MPNIKKGPKQFSSFRLKTDGTVSRLLVDGVDMSHALSAKFVHDGGEVPILTLVLPIEESEISGAACVKKEYSPAGAADEAK